MQFSSSAFAALLLLFVSKTAQAAVSPAPVEQACPANTIVVTGGGGNYNTGTNQVVSFYYPSASQARLISEVSICRAADGRCAPLANVSYGLPNYFGPNRPDTASAIGVTLPSALHMDTGNYIYRLQVLLANNARCVVDTKPFTVQLLPVHLCDLNQQKCKADGTGYQICIAGPRGNVYGETVSCGKSGCLQQGYFAKCATSTPVDAKQNTTVTVKNESCTIGVSRCVGSGFQQCIPKVGGGNQFSQVMACAPGTVCAPHKLDNNSISCVWPYDTVVSSEKTVGNKPAALTKVQQQQQQAAAIYYPPPPPAGNCLIAGSMQCVGENHWRQCVQSPKGANWKPTWEWGNLMSCGENRKCKSFLNVYIACV